MLYEQHVVDKKWCFQILWYYFQDKDEINQQSMYRY